jgi:hypothetical protein
MSIPFRRRRLILDSLLVLTVTLAIITYHQPRQVNAEQQSHMQTVFNSNGQIIGQPIADTLVLTGTETISNTVILANETIAAVIAVENAALTPPQYLTSLPVMTR